MTTQPVACPYCGQRPQPTTHTPTATKAPENAAQAGETRRPGGAQLAFGRAVEEWAAYLRVCVGLNSYAARTVAAHVCARAVPTRQRDRVNGRRAA